MTTKTPTAGQRLAAHLDAALARAGEELGHALEFEEAERHVIEQAGSVVVSGPPLAPLRP
jgi:hypothetical protein